MFNELMKNMSFDPKPSPRKSRPHSIIKSKTVEILTNKTDSTAAKNPESPWESNLKNIDKWISKVQHQVKKANKY